MKKVIIIGVLVIVASLIWHKAYQIGQQRYTYQVEPVQRFVPIPIIYDSYSAFAEWSNQDKGLLRVTWNQLLPPPPESRDKPYFQLIGIIYPDPQPYYVLKLNDRIFLEKAEHIEPLIHALCALSRGGPEENHPDTVAESIAALPEDKATLEALVARFKPYKAYSPF